MNTDRSLADHSATIELVDTHCHITSGILAAQVDNVIARADQAGVTRLVVVACDPKEWDQAAALRDAYPGRVWSAFGIHPHDASIATPAMFDRLSTI
ncbi:MAG: TatD family hydrolase, partial [Phycisphaerae bacterium]|nr:TatD family hydrolase [Phycisphaerae bacterium]